MYFPRHKPPRRYAQLGNDVPVPFLFDCCLGVVFQLIFSWFCRGITKNHYWVMVMVGMASVLATWEKVRKDPPMRMPREYLLITFSQPSKKPIQKFSKILASHFSESKTWKKYWKILIPELKIGSLRRYNPRAFVKKQRSCGRHDDHPLVHSMMTRACQAGLGTMLALLL